MAGALLPCALRVLCVLGLLGVGVGVGGSGVDYCRQLEELKLERGRGSEIPERALSRRGERRVLALSANGAAPAAARALLYALLRHALRYRRVDILLVDYSFDQLQALNETSHKDEFILSMSSAWNGTGPSLAECLSGACDLAGTRLSVLGSGAAPAERRLLARLAPGTPARCLRDWRHLLSEECGFLDNTTLYNTPCSNWPNSTCPAGAACVTVAVEPGDDEPCRLARALALKLRHLRLAPMSELRENRSVLFFDYMWSDHSENVWPAPPGPCPNASDTCSNESLPLSLALGDMYKLTRYAPPVLNLALRFRPPTALLRRVLANSSSLGLQAAACEAIVSTSSELACDWLSCNDSYCNPRPTIRIYVCEEEPEKDYRNFTNIVYRHWQNTSKLSMALTPQVIRIPCSNTDKVNQDLKWVMTVYKLYVPLRGVVAMGAAAASRLPETAAQAAVPLLLAAPRLRGAEPAPGTRSAAPGVPALAAAVRALLLRCGWRRLVLLREEDRCDIWKRSLGLAELLEESLVVATVLARAGNESAVLGELRALDARVVLVDASAGTAARLLHAAALAPLSGFVWIVVGAAGFKPDSDWLPNSTEFSYMTVGGWRGAAGGGSPQGGSARLRGALDAALARAWPPHLAPLADALLMVFEGVARFYKRYPQQRNDPHRPKGPRLFFEELDNITLEGVTHDMHANAPIPVFTYYWNASGPRLVGAWPAPEPADPGPLCGFVADGPTCYTTRSGKTFTPHCHDFAWAVLACTLALGVPAVCAARAARRRRLRRRDRAVEERALLRGGHSAAEAAAGAALAEHAVPRDALQLLDELGAGHYGVVHQAVLRRPDSAAQGVAAKAPRADAPAGAAAELLREAALLATLRHEHIVRFTGVCWEGGPLVLMEHAFYGDLRRYLRARRTLAERARAGLHEPEAAHVAAPALTRLAREAAAALGYLAHRRLVHRDIRAANCLVDARRSLKLADFGMARWLDQAGDGEYLCKRRAMFPVLWMAPESLSRGVFSAASDVWALGVLFLELATLGERPFGAWGSPRVLRHVRAGGAPPLPRDAAPSTRGMTAACWRFAAEERPSAAELVAYLAEHPRAVQPALEPHADADADADADARPATADTDLYIDEWTNV